MERPIYRRKNKKKVCIWIYELLQSLSNKEEIGKIRK